MREINDENTAKKCMLEGVRCLVAEDNVFALDIMITYLQSKGFRVEGAANGQIALEKYLAAQGGYDILFVDLQMPIMDGYEAARGIRSSGQAHAQSIPIVAMSGDLLDDFEVHGFSHQLKKPFQMQALLALMAAIFGD